MTYVRNIRNFYSIIAWHQQQEQRQIAAQEAETEQQRIQRKVSSNRTLNMPLSVL